MNTKRLSDPITSTYIEFRVDRILGYGGDVYAILIPYKTSRYDMMMLDMHVGEMNWQNEFKRDSNGVLQCGIGIRSDQGDWVWKWSNGKASQYESEKGEYSDAFKRAGFMWGIGRDLYDFPRIRVILNDKEYLEKDNRYKATGYLNLSDWTCDINDDF